MSFLPPLSLLFACSAVELEIGDDTDIGLGNGESGRIAFTTEGSGLHVLYLEDMGPDDEAFTLVHTKTDEVLTNPIGHDAVFELGELDAGETHRYTVTTVDGTDASATLTVYEGYPGGEEGTVDAPVRLSLNEPYIGYVDSTSYYLADLTAIPISGIVDIGYLGQDDRMVVDLVFHQLFRDGSSSVVLTCRSDAYCRLERSAFGKAIDEVRIEVTPSGPRVRGSFELTLSVAVE
jgi:hypothetical protein